MVSVANGGASHWNLRAIHCVKAASSREKIGIISKECVRLRCQVIINRSLREKISRRTSLSGKIAPSINTQVMIRARLIGFGGSMLSPEQSALPMSAPATPCVMVSIVRGAESLRLQIVSIEQGIKRNE